MSVASLNLTEGAFSEGLDSIVIRHYIAGYQKGTVLDVDNFTPRVIRVGHVVIREVATGRLKPLPVNAEETAYAAIPSGHEYAGFTVATVRKSLPIVGVIYAGEINDKCLPYSIDAIKPALKTALPQIVFAHD